MNITLETKEIKNQSVGRTRCYSDVFKIPDFKDSKNLGNLLQKSLATTPVFSFAYQKIQKCLKSKSYESDCEKSYKKSDYSVLESIQKGNHLKIRDFDQNQIRNKKTGHSNFLINPTIKAHQKSPKLSSFQSKNERSPGNYNKAKEIISEEANQECKSAKKPLQQKIRLKKIKCAEKRVKVPTSSKQIRPEEESEALPYPQFLIPKYSCEGNQISKKAQKATSYFVESKSKCEKDHILSYFEETGPSELLAKLGEAKAEDNNSHVFQRKDAFIAHVKKCFGSKLGDSRRPKRFNFMPLKVVWSQFLCNESISKAQFDRMSAFERLLFAKFLLRFGYIRRNGSVPFDLESTAVERLLKDYQSSKTENQLLAFAVREVFKRLMHPFSDRLGNIPFHRDMRLVRLNQRETHRFYAHYFGGCMDTIKRARLSDKIFADSSALREYITTVLSQSSRLLDEIVGYCWKEKRGVSFDEVNPNELNISYSQLLERYKYDTADKINRRINNYEIVLNNFDPVEDQEDILHWMRLILRDLGENPKVKIPFNVFEVNDAMQHMLSLIKNSKS